MRVFIAVDIDDKTRKAIANLQKQIASKVDVKKGDLKWVEPNNIHLTLKFLGEISDEQLEEVREIVNTVAQAHQKFNLEIESVGSFGGRSAKVVWVAQEKEPMRCWPCKKTSMTSLPRPATPKKKENFPALFGVVGEERKSCLGGRRKRNRCVVGPAKRPQ